MMARDDVVPWSMAAKHSMAAHVYRTLLPPVMMRRPCAAPANSHGGRSLVAGRVRDKSGTSHVRLLNGARARAVGLGRTALLRAAWRTGGDETMMPAQRGGTPQFHFVSPAARCKRDVNTTVDGHVTKNSTCVQAIHHCTTNV